MLSVLHRVRAPRRLLLVLVVAATFSVNIEPRQAEAQVSGPVILVDEYADRVVFWALGFPDQSDGVERLPAWSFDQWKYRAASRSRASSKWASPSAVQWWSPLGA